MEEKRNVVTHALGSPQLLSEFTAIHHSTLGGGVTQNITNGGLKCLEVKSNYNYTVFFDPTKDLSFTPRCLH